MMRLRLNTNWSRGLFEALAALLLAGGLCACSSHSAGDAALTETSPGASEAAVTTPSLPARRPAIEELNAAIPPLPPDGPRRNPSVNASVNRSGIEAIDSYSSALFDLPSQTLTLPTEADSNELSLCWAIYEFENLLPDTLPAMLETELAGELPGEYYIGVSDYALGGWRWRHISAPDGQDSAVATASSISPQSGSLYCVIAAFGGETLRIRKLSLLGDIALPPPAGFSASRDVQPRIVLSWEDPALSYDPDGDGPGTFDYSSITLMSAMDVHGPWQVLATLPKGSTTYYVYPHPQSGLPQIGQAMFFRLITNTPLAAGVPGNAELGLRKLATPTGLNATPGTYMDRVSLSWNSMAEAERYEVFARPVGQDSSALVYLGQTASQPQFSHWFNYPALFPAEDGVDYEYQVRAVHANGSHSELSAVAVGSRKALKVSNVVASQANPGDNFEISWNPLQQSVKYFIRLHSMNLPESSDTHLVSGLDDDSFTVPYFVTMLLLPGTDYEISVAAQLENPFGGTEAGPWSDPRVIEFVALPKPVLEITPEDGLAPLQAILDARQSSWPGESIVSYGWDFDNDGVIDQTTSSGLLVHDYPKGAYCTTVTITNADGGTSSTSKRLTSGGWMRGWSCSDQDETIYGLDLGPDGSVYAAGSFWDDVYLHNYAGLLLKRNEKGQLLWARSFVDVPSGSAVEVRFAAGSVWLMYWRKPTVLLDGSAVIARFDTDGELIWARRLDLSSIGGDFYPTGFSVDASGRSFCCGNVPVSYWPDPDFAGCFAMLDPDGNPLGLHLFSNTLTPSMPDFLPEHISIDSSGRAVLLGSAPDLGSSQSGFAVLAMQPDGSIDWQRGWEEAVSDLAAGVACLPTDDIVAAVTVEAGGAAGFQKLISFDSTGAVNWVKTPVFDSGRVLPIRSLQADGSGRVVAGLNSGGGSGEFGAIVVPADGSAAQIQLWDHGAWPLHAVLGATAMYLGGSSWNKVVPVTAACALPNDSLTPYATTFETAAQMLLTSDPNVVLGPASGQDDDSDPEGTYALMMKLEL